MNVLSTDKSEDGSEKAQIGVEKFPEIKSYLFVARPEGLCC